jgi:hypothetical protein
MSYTPGRRECVLRVNVWSQISMIQWASFPIFIGHAQLISPSPKTFLKAGHSGEYHIVVLCI